MPYNSQFDLRGQRIEDTFPQLLQYETSSNLAYDGLGNQTDVTALSSSFATSASVSSTSSYAVKASIASNANTASFAVTASFALNGGNGGTSLVTASTYPITASNARSASVLYASNGSASITFGGDNIFIENLNGSGSDDGGQIINQTENSVFTLGNNNIFLQVGNSNLRLDTSSFISMADGAGGEFELDSGSMFLASALCELEFVVSGSENSNTGSLFLGTNWAGMIVEGNVLILSSSNVITAQTVGGSDFTMDDDSIVLETTSSASLALDTNVNLRDSNGSFLVFNNGTVELTNGSATAVLSGGNLVVSSSILSNFSGSLFGTSSWSQQSLTSSLAAVATNAAHATTANSATSATSATFASSAATADNATHASTSDSATSATSASYAASASFAITASALADNVGDVVTLAGGFASMIDTAGDFVSLNNGLASLSDSNSDFIALNNGTITISANKITATNLTASVQGTASFAVSSSNALTASFALNATGGGTTIITASTYQITSSFSNTASYTVAPTSTSLNLSGSSTSAFLVDFNVPYYALTVASTTCSFVSSSNGSPVKSSVVFLTPSTASRALTFNSNWIFIGNPVPTLLTGSKAGVLSLTTYGSNESNVIASWGAQL